MSEKSEFGKGMVICLVKFAEHSMYLNHWLENYEKMRRESTSNDKDLWKESGAIHIWMNGASDHLYEIEVPEGKEWDRIRTKINKLKSKGIDMGHGYRTEKWTMDDAQELMNLTRKIAMMIDRKMGLKPDMGEF